jgi:hypothetical protein
MRNSRVGIFPNPSNGNRVMAPQSRPRFRRSLLTGADACGAHLGHSRSGWEIGHVGARRRMSRVEPLTRLPPSRGLNDYWRNITYEYPGVRSSNLSGRATYAADSAPDYFSIKFSVGRLSSGSY